MSAQKTKSPQGAQLIVRAASLLRAIPRGSPNGRRLHDLSVATGLSEPTVRRILKALIFEDLVSQDSDTRLYRLGPLAFELGLVQNPYVDMVAACAPFIRDLARKTGDTAFFGIRSGIELVILDRANGDYPIRALAADPGMRFPLGVGGIAIMMIAVLPDDEIEEILPSLKPRLAEYGIKVKTVRERIAATRKQGYANIPNQPLPEAGSIGVPVPRKGGVPKLGVGTSAIISRFTRDRIQLTVDAATECAARIAETLGGRN